MREKLTLRECVAALIGIAGFVALTCTSPTIPGQLLNAVLAFGLIGLAALVYKLWPAKRKAPRRAAAPHRRTRKYSTINIPQKPGFVK